MLDLVGQIELTGRRVFVRADLDVPLGERQQILDDLPIRNALPTVELALKKGARVVLASHLGRPDRKHSLEPAAARLAELLDREVRLADECVGDGVRKLIMEQRAGELVMLENLFFHPGEEANDPEFAKALAALCEIYVDDAFSCAHRTWASNVGMVAHVAGPRVAGLQLSKELEGRGLETLAGLPAVEALLKHEQSSTT